MIDYALLEFSVVLHSKKLPMQWEYLLGIIKNMKAEKLNLTSWGLSKSLTFLMFLLIFF